MQIVHERFDQRPQVELAAFQLDPHFGLQAGVLLEHLADETLEVLHVAAQRFQHPRGLGVWSVRPTGEFQNAARQRNGVQRGSQVVRHESEILFAAALHLERPLGGIGLQGQSDRMVQYPIDDVERLALQVQTVLIGEIVNAAAQNVVLRDDLVDIERVFDALQTVRRRTHLEERFRDGLVGFDPQRRGQLVDQPRHVIVERRRIERASRRQLPHLFTPARQQKVALPRDELCQFVEIVSGHPASADEQAPYCFSATAVCSPPNTRPFRDARVGFGDGVRHARAFAPTRRST